MKDLEITLRRERPEDYRAVEELTREAFWNHYVPGCNEHYLLNIMRNLDCFIGELDLVAETEGRIVGNIVYTRAMVIGDGGESREVATFGPISVHPVYQGKGIGGTLIETTKRMAAEQGFRAILIYGDPAYYSRFGFVPAESFGIGTGDDQYAAALQAFELVPGALNGIPGRFVEAEIFDIDPEAAEKFDKGFPPKERCGGLPSQVRFQEVVKMRKPRK